MREWNKARRQLFESSILLLVERRQGHPTLEFLTKETDFKMGCVKTNIIKKKLSLSKKNYSKSTQTFRINVSLQAQKRL